MLLPLITFLSDELYMVTTQWNIAYLSPSDWYLVMFLILIAWAISQGIKSNNQEFFNFNTENSRFVFPVLLVAIVAFVNYQPVIDQPRGLFEIANPANGIMRAFEFGEIPILEALSSHLPSEQAFKHLYTLLNGYNGSLDFLIYDFGRNILLVIVTYFVLKPCLGIITRFLS